MYKIVMRKYNAHITKIDDISKEKGPCFILFNHLSRLDHIYVLGSVFPKRFNMLAGYNEFFRSHLVFAFKHNQVLPKKNYCANDVLSMRIITKMIKKGAKIAFAPEGLASNDGTPKPIVPNTGHMLKHYKIPVYFVELRGTYLQNTKVCMDERYGETYAKTYKLFSVEDLEKLSVEEIDDKINNAIRHDEYAWQKEHHIKWDMKGRSCYQLDHLLYRCPSCKTNFSIVSSDNTIECKNCSFKATVDEYYDLKPLNKETVVPDKISDWVNEERVSIIKEIRANKDFKYVTKADLGILPNDHFLKNLAISDIVSSGDVICDHDGLHFRGSNKERDFDVSYKDLFTLITVLDSNSVQFYLNGEYISLEFEKGGGLYLTMLVEEMHRLHVNFYKNFKWNDWMYKE